MEPLDLRHYSGFGTTVAVVDSGIDVTHPKIDTVAAGTRITVIDDRIGTDNLWHDDSGHGTACAGIIKSVAPDCVLHAVRIFDDTLEADWRAVVAAIDWCIAQGVDVVNLSLGGTDFGIHDDIAAACKRAYEANMVVVAAQNNDGRDSYPAVLSEVIGVAGGRLKGGLDFHFQPNSCIELVGKADEQRLCWTNGTDILGAGTSFAAPHISGAVSLIREALHCAPVDVVRAQLELNASNRRNTSIAKYSDGANSPDYIEHHNEPAQLGHIQKAALYPYNKEMHAFVRFRDLLRFELVGVADAIGRGLTGKDVGAAIGVESMGFPIRARIEDALADADTLIIGYVDELGRIGGRDVLREAIETALQHNLNVFSFLPVRPEDYVELYDLAKTRALRIDYPDIPTRELYAICSDRLYPPPVDAPVVGVFGTSSNQGKFTIQLSLRRELEKAGYRVAQLGTEHHSALFGMDVTFPMGYASPIKVPCEHWVRYLDKQMRLTCQRKQPDIFIVGSQSGTVPYDVHDIETLYFTSFTFLLGVKPDACILVVNALDPDDYIQETIDGLRAFAKAPTLALATSDNEKRITKLMGKKTCVSSPASRGEHERRVRQLREKFGVPVVSTASKEGAEVLCEVLTQYFSEC